MNPRRYRYGVDVDGHRMWSETVCSLEYAYILATELRELVNAEVLLGEGVGNGIKIIQRWSKTNRRHDRTESVEGS